MPYALLILNQVYFNTLNYARVYLPELPPDVSTLLYIDPDTVANGDVVELMDAFTRAAQKVLPLTCAGTTGQREKRGKATTHVNKESELLQD